MPNRRRICGWLLAALFIFSGCSSLKDKARDFLQAGAYEQALSYYQLAVEKDPGDAEARAGLQQARTVYVDKKLIETRMARMSGNAQNAMDILLDIVQKQKQWQYAPYRPDRIHPGRRNGRGA